MGQACIEAYHTPDNFLKLFTPNNQYAYCKDIRRAYMGTAPALGVVSNAFGENVTKAWLSIQLIDLSEFSGCKDKLSTFQISSIAEVIMAEWGYVKVTELMHFFLQFKAGRYGKFYGAVDGLVITEALQEFARERFDRVVKYEQEEAAARKAVEDAEHERQVKRFHQFLNDYHLSIEDYLMFCDMGITDLQEIAEIYWLFKMGYETDTRGIVQQTIDLINAIRNE